MHTSLGLTVRLRHSLLVLGALSLAAVVVLQTFGAGSAASANSRDEFPGRRQGGGTHWITPDQTFQP